MSEYSVQINSRSLGVTFYETDDDQVSIATVSANSIGFCLGICVGDILCSINDTKMSTLASSVQYAFKDITHIFYDQALPFKATFHRSTSQNILPCDINVDITDINAEDISLEVVEYSPPSSPSYGASTDANTPSLSYKSISFASTVSNVSKCEQNKFQFDAMSDTKGYELKTILNVNSYINQMFVEDQSAVHFDQISVTESNQKMCLLSSNGLKSGQHTWAVQILKTDIEAQEIGVVGCSEIEGIDISDEGISATNAFGARAVYGSELGTNKNYYGSYNEDGKGIYTNNNNNNSLYTFG